MLIFSWLAYYGFLIFIHFSTMFNSCASMYVTFTSSLVYLNFIIVVGITGSIDLFLYSWNMNFGSDVATALMIERKAKGNLESANNLPKNLEKYVRMFKKMNE